MYRAHGRGKRIAVFENRLFNKILEQSTRTCVHAHARAVLSSFDRVLIFIRSNKNTTIFRARSRTFLPFFFCYSLANCLVTKRLQSRVGGREEWAQKCIVARSGRE